MTGTRAPAKRLSGTPWRGVAAAAVFAVLACAAALDVHAQGDPRRGEYLAVAGGCIGCHTAQTKGAAPFAGGRALITPFGTFHGPNITPHAEHGIGRWTEAQFVRAMRSGERPDGANYYPAFPYTSFTQISDEDLRHLWAYLRSLPPNSRVNQPHELGLVYRWRPLLSLWKWFFFTPGPAPADARLDAVANRGRYLVNALSHCGECHTPRNRLGGLQKDRLLAGGKGPEGKRIPNLTPSRLKSWSDADLKEFLTSGLTPDGDAANETMDEVIRNTTSKLTAEDLQAIIAYLRSLPALDDPPRKE